MNKITRKTYIYLLALLAVFMQGCESGEATPSVSSEEINEAVTEISSSQLAKGSVTAGTIAENAVTPGTIAENAVTPGTIAENAVTATEIKNGTVGSDEIAANAVTSNKLAAALLKRLENLEKNAVPAGVIMAWSGKEDKIPNGWAHANGDTIDCTGSNYQELCNALNNVSWGISNTNKLPDLRGLVLRGLDTTNIVDPDCDTRGAIQYSNEGISRLIFANSNGVYVDGNTNLGIDSNDNNTIKNVTIDNNGNISSYGNAVETNYSVYGITGCEVGSYQGDEFKSHSHKYSNPLIGTEQGLSRDDSGSAVEYPSENGSTTLETGGNETRMKNAAVHYIISCGNGYPESSNICTR